MWEDDSKIAWTLQSKSYVEGNVGETTLFVTELPEFGQNYELLLSHIATNINIEELNESDKTTK